MRKFKIRNLAARRMLGLDNAPRETSPAETGVAAPVPEKPEGNQVLRVTSRTDVGLVRKNNQDAVILGNGLMGIADGMGGHQGGETASIGTRDGLIRALEGKKPDRKALEDAVKEVNLELWNRAEGDESLSGMGTTLSVIWPAEEQMLIAHVGDSRIYLLRDGRLRQVTKDHSMVADMVRKGLLTEEQAAVHPMRNYITRAVGTEPTIQVDILGLERQSGDRWLICSDGLHGLVDREELQRLMASGDLEEAADQMMREALDRGGRDNISLVLISDETPQQDPRETVRSFAPGSMKLRENAELTGPSAWEEETRESSAAPALRENQSVPAFESPESGAEARETPAREETEQPSAPSGEGTAEGGEAVE